MSEVRQTEFRHATRNHPSDGSRAVAAVVIFSMLLSCNLLSPSGLSSYDSRDLASDIDALMQAGEGAIDQTEADTWASLRAPLREQLGEDADSVFQQLDEGRQSLLTRVLRQFDIAAEGAKPAGLAQFEAPYATVFSALYAIPEAFADHQDGSGSKTVEDSDGETTLTITKSASQITAEVEILISRPDGSGRLITETGNGKMDIQLCPDAEGRAPINVSMTLSSQLSLGDEVFELQLSFDDSSDVLVNDDAEITGLIFDFTSSFGGQSTSGKETYAETHTEYKVGVAGERWQPSDFTSQVIRTSSRADKSVSLAFFQRANKMLYGFTFFVAKLAEEIWQNGYCVEILVDDVGDSSTVATRSATAFTARVRHKFQGGELRVPIQGTLSGKQDLRPTEKTMAPVAYTYTAPGESGTEATVSLETRSRRGVARRKLTFSTGGAYDVSGGSALAWSGFICTLKQPFELIAETGHGALPFQFTPGNDPMSGTWTYHNPESSGEASEDGQGTYAVSLEDGGGSITANGEGILQTALGPFSFDIHEMFELTPTERCGH